MSVNRMFNGIDTSELPDGHSFTASPEIGTPHELKCGEVVVAEIGRRWECRHGFLWIQGDTYHTGVCGFGLHFRSKADIQFCTKKHRPKNVTRGGCTFRATPPDGPHEVKPYGHWNCVVDEEYTAQVNQAARD